jgi:hypothetical protein
VEPSTDFLAAQCCAEGQPRHFVEPCSPSVIQAVLGPGLVWRHFLSRYLLRDRDKIFGDDFRRQVADMKIQEVLSAPRSPWQRAYVERVIGSIRRECLDHVIVFNETGLRRMLSVYFSYYHETRPHLSLEKDSPEPRKVQPPELGQVVAVPQVGGLHHRYERCAA